jgi:hypothetical protein
VGAGLSIFVILSLSVFAALVVSLVQTDGEVAAVVTQIIWLVGIMALLWLLMLNKKADRILCLLIGKILESTTFLGERSFHRLLQVGDGYSVCEHKIATGLLMADGRINDDVVRSLSLTPLAIRSPDGKLSIAADTPTMLSVGDTIVLFGPDAAHDALRSG